MILDSGICSIFRKSNQGGAGEMPTPSYTLVHTSWYGELMFETTPISPTKRREDVKTDARIRIIQNRRIKNHDVLVLSDTSVIPDQVPGKSDRAPIYEISRAYHGVDNDSGELISDLTLEEVEL